MQSTDHLFIEKMDLNLRIGETAKERAFPQLVQLSAKIYVALSTAGKTDRMSDTVDYAACVKKILALQKRPFNLVEALAERAAAILLEPTGVSAVELTIYKRPFPGISAIGARIFREKIRGSAR
jgi:dihydroneopterin aldolase